MWEQIQQNKPKVPKNVGVMEDILKEISSHIHLKKAEIKKYNNHLKSVLDVLINEMKQDEVFAKLYNKICYSGSYYENLRVKTPDEFDLNLELKLPKLCRPFKILTDTVEPGFALIQLSNTIDIAFDKVQPKIKKWLDSERFLLRDRVLRWLQSVVDKALTGIHWSTRFMFPCNVYRRRSGPAIMLLVKIDNACFSVDLVPMISFTKECRPGPPVRQLEVVGDAEWCIVPKGPRSGDDTERQWRMSFYNYEKAHMRNLENMKPIIKILKLLRDAQNWSPLSSYYVKTIFLWELEHQKEARFWRNSLSYIFYHMLCVLENCLHNHYIPFFWQEGCNLLQHINRETTGNWTYYIRIIRKRIDNRLNEPQELKTYLINIFMRDEQHCRQSVGGTSVNDREQEEPHQSEQQQSSNVVLGITLGAVITGVLIGAFSFFNNRPRNRTNQ